MWYAVEQLLNQACGHEGACGLLPSQILFIAGTSSLISSQSDFVTVISPQTKSEVGLGQDNSWDNGSGIEFNACCSQQCFDFNKEVAILPLEAK